MSQQEPHTCRGDSVMVIENVTAPYGTTVVINGVDCAVEKTAVTCTNRDGHGFTIARDNWSVF